MKLDPRVITILQNFGQINPSIAVQPGNTLKTISSSLDVMAKATTSMEFPIEFGIYDLKRFLALASLFNESEIEFHDTSLLVKSGNSTIRYTYCDTEMMIKPTRDVKLASVEVEFELKSEVLTSIMKAIHILKYNNVVIAGDGEQLTISAEHEKNKAAETFSVELGQTDKTFRAIIDSEKMKLLLPTNFVVQLCKSGIAYFRGDDIEYWISMQDKSKF